jgi:antitoxin ParD1/3/4
MSGRPNPENLTVKVASVLAGRVRDAVAAGEYASESDVVSDALRLWEQRRLIRERDLSILQAAWDDGKASGTAGEVDIERLLAEEKAALAS